MMKDWSFQGTNYLRLNKPAYTKIVKFDDLNESTKVDQSKQDLSNIVKNKKHNRAPSINLVRINQSNSPSNAQGLFSLPDISSKFNKKSVANYFKSSKTPLGVSSIKPPDILDPCFKEYERRVQIAKYEKESMIDQLQKETSHYYLKKKERSNFDSWLNEVIN